MQIWIWNDFQFPKLVKWFVFLHLCRFVWKVFWRSSEDSLEFASNILGVLEVYGAKHSPSFSCFGGPSGWFWGSSEKRDNVVRKPLIFAIWGSLASWDEEVCFEIVLRWCKYEFGMIFAPKDSEMTSLWACLQVRPEGVLEVFPRSSGVFEQYLWCLKSIWCEALSFVLLFWWPFGLILGLFRKTW